MQAAAAVAKAATTAALPAGVEFMPAIVNVAAAAPAAAETAAATAAIPAATETMGGVAKALETGVKIESAAPDALSAATDIDAALKTGTAAPEAAMENLVASHAVKVENVGQAVNTKEIATPETSAINAEWAEQKYTEIFQTVKPQMEAWDKSHFPGPGDDIPEWTNQRAAVEKQYTVDEAVSRDLEDWKFKHPEPDKVKDETGHADWVKQLATQQEQSRQTNADSYERFLAQQEEKNRGMSKQEFMRKYARLLQLRAITDQYAMNLQRLRVSGYKTPEYKAGLTQAEAQLESQRAEIGLLEGELQFDAIKSGSLWKQYIIPAAVGIAMVAGPMAASANET